MHSQEIQGQDRVGRRSSVNGAIKVRRRDGKMTFLGSLCTQSLLLPEFCNNRNCLEIVAYRIWARLVIIKFVSILAYDTRGTSEDICNYVCILHLP